LIFIVFLFLQILPDGIRIFILNKFIVFQIDVKCFFTGIELRTTFWLLSLILNGFNIMKWVNTFTPLYLLRILILFSIQIWTCHKRFLLPHFLEEYNTVEKIWTKKRNNHLIGHSCFYRHFFILNLNNVTALISLLICQKSNAIFFIFDYSDFVPICLLWNFIIRESFALVKVWL